MDVRLDIFQRDPDMAKSLSLDRAVYFYTLIGEIKETLAPLRDEIDAEERASTHGHIYTVVNLLQFRQITVFHIGYSPQLSDRMSELTDAIDFEIIKNDLKQTIIIRNN